MYLYLKNLVPYRLYIGLYWKDFTERSYITLYKVSLQLFMFEVGGSIIKGTVPEEQFSAVSRLPLEEFP